MSVNWYEYIIKHILNAQLQFKDSIKCKINRRIRKKNKICFQKFKIDPYNIYKPQK